LLIVKLEHPVHLPWDDANIGGNPGRVSSYFL